ncbi:hypothetical protein CBR_g48325 [Chara braunii]|uniref:CCHC-type domain-containing protein n=1 Tax=Chara braunii TaxID=69332 RepID=A0A388K491_CHABU|nr:hypothetical protein CBR_g48325 [Chara braunii]|eukprot:GBG64857.1 hypothetical protein CBR_g48325 [Chara braunii]
MPEEMADGGRKLVTLDDLIDAVDKRERAPSNVPKVETFHFKGDRVSDWLDLTEQALVGLSDEVKLQRVLRYVLHSHHREVTKVVDAAGGSWAKFGDLMRRKYRLGDGLLTMADLEAMNKEDFSTVGAFGHEFKKRARKVHGISEEAQCATFLGLLTGSEATELTKYGKGSERLTWETIDKGVEEGSLDQVEQHQMRLQRRKRKERDATASGTPGVKKIVTDVLAALGYDSEAELQKKVVAVAQGLASGVGDEEAGREDYGGGETGSQALTKAQRKQRNLLLGGQGLGKGQTPQDLAAPPPVATAAPAPAPARSSHMGPPPSCGYGRLKAGTIKEEPIVVESDDEAQEVVRESASTILERMEDLLAKVGRYQERLRAMCEKAREWEMSLPEVMLHGSGPESSSGPQGCPSVATAGAGPMSGMTFRPPTSHGRVPQAAQTRGQSKATTSQGPSQAPSRAPPRKDPEPERRKEVVEVQEKEDEGDDEEDERLRQEEDRRAEQRAKKRGAQGGVEPTLHDGVPKRKKYAVRLEEGFDVERMVDKLLKGHNDLMNLKDILTSAPRLRGELKGRLSRRLMPNVHLSSILPREIKWTEAGTRMDWKCVACRLVDFKVRDQPSIAMVDTGAEMNIIRERDATMLGLEVDHSDHGVLHGANCKAIFCGTASNVMVEIGGERTLMVETMRRRHCAYAFNDDERGRLDVDKIPMIRIHIVPHEPWNLRGARYPNPDEEKNVVDYLDGKMRTYVADYSSGPYASSWFCSIKPNGTLRWVQDLQRLNAVTVRDAGGLPNADALSESCAGRPIISLIDLYSGYDQFPVYPPDRPVTAMHTPRGLIHMNVTPQGWTNAVAMVQRHMIRAMQTVSPHITQPYIDDLAVKDPKEKEEDEVMPGVRRFVWKHVQDIDQVLGLLEEHNLAASGPKSKHCMREATILGFVCNEKGRRSDVKKTDKILEWPVPFQSITDVRSFLGTCGFWRSFVKDFATKTEHLRKLRLRASPRGRDDVPIRLEDGNADEFIPAYEHYMLSLGVAWEEWVQTLLIWTRQAERQVAKQIRERARDWEDCQAQLRRVFGRPQHERHEPRVERRRRSKRPREPAPREARLAGERRGAPAQREDEPAGPALAEESFPACGLRAVEFRQITNKELRPPSPLPSTQELDIPRETPFRSLATHLDVSQWEASRLGEGSVEPACYVPLEEPLDPELETDMRDREEPQGPEMAAEWPDPVRPQGREVITVGDDTPPCSPAPEPAQRSWPEGIPEPGSEEIPEFPPEATTVPEQEAEAEDQGVCERARVEAPFDLPSATHVAEGPVIEEPIPMESPPAVPRTSERMRAEVSTNELRVKELEVEHLTTQLAEERARIQAREVEWERRFGEMATAMDRLSAAWEASQMRPNSQGCGTQAPPNQEVAVEVRRQAEPMEEAPLDAVEEESGAQESLMAMSTERRSSRLHELAAAMGIITPQERPQRLDAPEQAPRLGELRAELGSWATGTESRGSDSRRQQQQQEVMSEPTTMMGSQPSGSCRDEVVVVAERAHGEGPRGLDMPDCRPVSTVERGSEGAEAMEPGPQGHMGLPSCHEVTTETMGTPSASSSQGRKKKTARWHHTSCFWCKEEGHRAVDCPELLEDKAEGRVAEFSGKFYDRQGKIVERAPDGGRAQLYRQDQEELCK